jgi:hypothetical protein
MSAKVSGTTISLTRGDSLIIQISVNQEGKPYEVKPGDKIRFAMKKDLQDSEPLIMKQIALSQDDNLLDENSQPVLDETGNVVTATFKTPPEIASNSKAVWSRWYKINGIGV